MFVITSNQFDDYRLLDTGDGNRLEQWGEYRLVRPDPQIIWQRHLPAAEWQGAHAIFQSGVQSQRENGKWIMRNPVPESWIVKYDDVKLEARLTPFKHTGIFPEQAANWDWMVERTGSAAGRDNADRIGWGGIASGDAAKIGTDGRAKIGAGGGAAPAIHHQKLKILNLFGYTGAASVILAKHGHFVTHVDASKPALAWAKRNQALNNLPANSIRWILDDTAKFAAREAKRGQSYDGIIMDPPAFGHSPSGKTWKFNRDMPRLLADCVKILSPRPSFLLINAYATNSSPLALRNLAEDILAARGGAWGGGTGPAAGQAVHPGQASSHLESGELCLQQTDGRLISTGIVTRWSA